VKNRYRYKQEEASMLQNLTAVVTGSGRGIGKAVALALARQGANVIVNDLYPETVQNVVEEIISLGGQAFAWAHDISREDTIESLTETEDNRQASYLASPHTKFVTGSVIAVDGGFTMH
jgi:NAD(P)-dependent dehydrogenase (short-subunit alcohol dehydrogenase family)